MELWNQAETRDTFETFHFSRKYLIIENLIIKSNELYIEVLIRRSVG